MLIIKASKIKITEICQKKSPCHTVQSGAHDIGSKAKHYATTDRTMLKKKNGLRHTTNKCATVNHHCYKSSVTFKEIKGPFTQAKGTKEISILIITKVVLHLKIPEG